MSFSLFLRLTPVNIAALLIFAISASAALFLIPTRPPWLAASFILGLRINPFRYASVVHPTDAVLAQALGVAFEAGLGACLKTAAFHEGAPRS